MTAVTQARIEAIVARGTWRNLEQIAAGLVQDAESVAQSATRMNPVLGGGTRLMLAMKHRISDGLDLFIRDPQWLGYLTPRKNPLLENTIGGYTESNDFLQFSLIEGDIRFFVSGSLLDLPTEKAPNCHFELEHPAEILAKNFFYGGSGLRPQDLFDWRSLENRYSPDELHIKAIAKLLRGRFGDKIDMIESALDWFDKPSVGEIQWDEILAPPSLNYRESVEWAKLRLEQFRIPEPGERTRVRPRAKTGFGP